MPDFIPTPHISAEKGDFARTVLMPGDPLRSRFIAENFLQDIRLVNNVRGVQGYTGRYQGHPVSVMASGMGMPSMGIYSYELFRFYGVENILRVGTAGALQERVRLWEVVLGMGACTNSAFAAQYGLPGTFAPVADHTLLRTAAATAEALSLPFHVGNLLSSDTFYSDDGTAVTAWGRMGVLAVEMEAAALYLTAARTGKRALAICTVSDHLLTGESTDAAQRQTAFTDMMRLALEVAAQLDTP
ncbi:MAG: purine-nucleoside phosphorylase [Eubacteriales bacterium]